MKTVPEIIQACGGPERVEAEAIARGSKLTAWAVKKWGRNGIPEKHWPLITDLSNATIEQIFSANAALRASPAPSPEVAG